MARIKTGEYAIWFFDNYGERQKLMDVSATHQTEAVKIGEAVIADADNCASSFTVIRAIFNSLDPKNKL